MAMGVDRSMSLEFHYGAGIDGRYQQLHADASVNWVAATDRDRAAMTIPEWNAQWNIFPGLPPAAATGAGLHGYSTRIGWRYSG